MKYLSYCLSFLIFFSTIAGSLNAQVIESDYLREGEAVKVEVLGVEKESEVEMVEEEEVFDNTLLVDALAVLGGFALIGLFVYIIYSNKEKN